MMDGIVAYAGKQCDYNRIKWHMYLWKKGW